MKKCRMLLLTLFVAVSTFAQNTPEKFAATITAADLQKQLTIIAGAEMEGRETGTEGQRKAAAYIEAQFKQIGLLPPATLKGYQQYYPVSKDSITSSSLTINGTNYVWGKDYMVSAQSNQDARIKTRRLVFGGYGIDDPRYSDYTGKNIKGRVLIIFSGEPKKDGNYIISGNSRNSEWGTFQGASKKALAAKAKGAAMVLLISPNMDTINSRTAQQNAKTNMYFVGNNNDKAHTITISHQVARDLLGEAAFSNLLAIAKQGGSFDAAPTAALKGKAVYRYKEASDNQPASNVIGYIEGTEKKDEYLIITAHYDHLGKRGNTIFYGADDDGSGTCGVIEMAEAFAAAKAAGNGPKRSVVFMTVSGEEKGLWGSEFYSDHPVFALDKTTADLNIDMVGRVDTERNTADTLNYVYVVGHNKLSTELPLINEGANNKYTSMVLDYKYDDPNDKNRIYYRSDHYNFARKGVPVLFFYDGMLKADYHKPTDTVEKINFALYEKRVRMIFYTAWEMANRADMLKRDIPLQ